MSADCGKPFISIIVPTYNRPKQLRNCLTSLAQLNYPADCFEVIVVDDGSLQSVGGIVDGFRPKLTLTLITQPNAGPATARNTGARQATGAHLTFLDDDCTVDPSWLSAIADALAANPNSLVSGQTINALPQNCYATASQLLIDYLLAVDLEKSGQPQFFPSNQWGVSAEKFHKLGGFDTTFRHAAGEDRDFCDRWQQHGFTLYKADEALVYHWSHLTLKAFGRQNFQYGKGAYYFRQRKAQRQRSRLKLEALTFYCGLIFYPLKRRPHTPRAILISLLFLSQVAITLGFLRERLKR